MNRLGDVFQRWAERALALSISQELSRLAFVWLIMAGIVPGLLMGVVPVAIWA